MSNFVYNQLECASIYRQFFIPLDPCVGFFSEVNKSLELKKKQTYYFLSLFKAKNLKLEGRSPYPQSQVSLEASLTSK